MGFEELLGGILRDVLKKNAPAATPKLEPLPRRTAKGPAPARPSRPAEPESGIGRVMHSVVQIVALRKGFLGGMSTAWTGSGTIVDPSGIILTNCHVADPRAMGMSAPPADRLGISITERSDQPPALSYFARPVVVVPELDLAVLQIVADVNGRPVRDLDLPAVDIGNSDQLELGDRLAIFGYPGIGGETVTYTSGNVSGFSSEKGINTSRAWIKTDATIAGGNSGGTAVNETGELVGIPTQAAAGAGVTPVDARPVLDTNHDGRVDQRDTPMAVGGFINGLRPVNLALPLLEKAGVRIERDSQGKPSRRTTVMPADNPFSRSSQQEAETFDHLLFSTQVTDDGRPINPTAQVPSGVDTVYATFEHANLQPGTKWSVVWMSNEKVIIDQQDEWDDAPNGRKAVKISNRKGLPSGEYHLVLGIGSKVALEGKMFVGTPVDDTDAEISGRLVDSNTGRAVSKGVVFVLKPGAAVRDFMRTQDQSLVVTSSETDADGRFKLPEQLPKGQAYGLIAAAENYRPVAVEGALRVGTNSPEHANIGNIELSPA